MALSHHPARALLLIIPPIITIFLGTLSWYPAFLQAAEKEQAMKSAVSAKLLNDQAESFVNRANEWIKQRSVIDSEFKRATQALEDACARNIKESSEDLTVKPSQTVTKRLPLQSPDSFQVNRLKVQKQDISALKAKMSEELGQRCGNTMRAPGLRNDQCLGLEMLAQWAVQTEQFIDMRLHSEISAQDLIQRISILEGQSCPASRRLSDVRLKMLQIMSSSQLDADLLMRQTFERIYQALGARP